MNYSDEKAAAGGSNSRKSIPRPIHYTRELNEKPASNEPKSSYTDDSEYLNEEYFLGKLGRSGRKYKASRTLPSTESLKTFDSSETNSMTGQPPRNNHHAVYKSHSVGTMIVEMDDEVFSPPQNKLIEDSNNNNVWDTGNYLKRVKPEPVYYFPSELEVRANWDLNETFDLNIKESVNDSIN